MKIHLVRHGETNWNAEGRLQGHALSELSARGRAEAEALARQMPPHFRDWPVYASDLRRTVETAHILHGGFCPRLQTSPLLREIGLGRWEGRLRSEVETTEPELFYQFKQVASRFRIEAGESFHDVQKRGLRFLQSLQGRETGDEILVVSHRGLIKTLLSYYENRSLDEIWSEPTIPNCSLSTLELLENGSCLIRTYGKSLALPAQ